MVQVQYHDGSMLSVIPQEMGGGIEFTFNGGLRNHYGPKEELPELVRNKLSEIPSVIKHLMDNNADHTTPMFSRPNTRFIR